MIPERSFKISMGMGAEMKAWRGLHMRADGHSHQADYDCLRIAGLNAAKLMTNTGPEDMDKLIATGIAPDHIVMRLFADMHNRLIREATPERFVEWTRVETDWFIAKGGRYVEVHNEPNLPGEGLGTQWMNPFEFSGWFLDVYTILRARYAGKILIGFPGLSPQPNVPEWLNACSDAYLTADWIGAHAYWSRPEDWNNPEEGFYFTRYLRFGRPVMVTEFSNKFSYLLPFDKGRAYAQYWDALPIQAAFCFVSSASNREFGWGARQSGEVWVMESGMRTQIPDGIASWSSPTPSPEPPPTNESGTVVSVDAVGGWDADLVNWLRQNHPEVRYGSVRTNLP